MGNINAAALEGFLPEATAFYASLKGDTRAVFPAYWSTLSIAVIGRPLAVNRHYCLKIICHKFLFE